MKKLILGFILLFTSTVFAGEKITLTAPDQAVIGTSEYYVAGLIIDRDALRVEIRLGSPGGFRRTFVFSGEDARTYMNAINKRNATVTSNEKWTLNQLINLGYLAGTVSGTPD